MEIYNQYALHFPRLLENPASYISYSEYKSKETNIPWSPWLSGGDEVPHLYGEMWKILDSDDNDATKLLDTYDKAVIFSVEKFIEYLNVPRDIQQVIIEKIKNNRPRALAIKRYYVGEDLGPHTDADPNADPEKIPLTISVYFNEGYIGGQLGFGDGSKIDLTAGSVVVFPATYLHESTKVTSGIKYVSNEVIVLNRSDLGVEVP